MKPHFNNGTWEGIPDPEIEKHNIIALCGDKDGKIHPVNVYYYVAGDVATVTKVETHREDFADIEYDIREAIELNEYSKLKEINFLKTN